MRGPAATLRGPLSWQQAFSLRREARLGVRSENVAVEVPLPAETHESLRDRLTRVVAREDALRIVGLPADEAGAVTYAEPLEELPLELVHVDSREECDRLVAELGAFWFRRDVGKPLWRVLLVEHPGAGGRPTRTALLCLDHHVADARSGGVLATELADAHPDGRPGRRGRYRDWVSWQLERFPQERAASVPTPARDFWRRYFEGSAPSHANALPFCDPGSRLTGLERHVNRELPLAAEGLRAAARRLGTTPFVLFAGCVAAAVAQESGEDDVTLRYVAHGRFPPFLTTIGWFADNSGLRVRDPALADPQRAVRAATASRMELIEFETTPWGYVMDVCPGSVMEQPQVVLNFFPLDEDGPVETPPDVTIGGAEPEPGHDLPPDLGLNVDLPRTGTGLLQCRFDPERFATDGVEEFVRLIFRNLTALGE